MEKLDSFDKLMPGLYEDAECTKILSSWNSLEDNGIVQLSEGTLSCSPTLGESLRGVLVIPSCVKKIDDCGFAHDDSLKGVITLGELEKIGQFAFVSCSALEFVQLDCAKICDHAFMRCAKLHSVKNRSSKKVTIDDGAFAWCISLETVELPKGCTTAKNAFFGCNQEFNVVEV